MTDTEYMQIALGEAQKAYNEGEIPIGAVLVYKDIILAADHNRCEATFDPTSHAEVNIIRARLPFSFQMAFDGHAALCYHRAMPNVRRCHHECPHPASDLRRSQSHLRRYRLVLPHRRRYGKSHLGHHFRDPEREVSDTHGRFLYPSPEIISSWSSIEVVITRRTRNPLAFRGPWVRIPPAPPKETLFAFFGQRAFLFVYSYSISCCLFRKTLRPR